MRHDDPAPDTPLDLAALARLADVSPRTVRYYLQQGLLPAPVGRGPGAYYTADHLARLRLIRAWQERHQPLAAIRAALAPLDAAGVRAALAALGPRTPGATTTALEYVRALLGEPAPQAQQAAPAHAAPAPLPRAEPTGSLRAARVGPVRERTSVGPTDDDDVVAMDAVGERAASDARLHDAAPAPAADQLALFPRPTRATWERHTIAADVELHIRRPLTRDQQRRVDQLLDLAAQLFREDA